MMLPMTKPQKQSKLRALKEELTDIQQRTEIYNNVVEQMLKKINKRYGRLNVAIDDASLLNEIGENDKRFIDVLKSMIAVEERVSKEGKRKYAMVYNQFARMVDRTASSMTKKTSSYTLNFCLRRNMMQNTIMLKKMMEKMDAQIKADES